MGCRLRAAHITEGDRLGGEDRRWGVEQLSDDVTMATSHWRATSLRCLSPRDTVHDRTDSTLCLVTGDSSNGVQLTVEVVEKQYRE